MSGMNSAQSGKAMAKIMEIGGRENQQVFVTAVDKVELATQVAAIIRASFKPLTDSDIRDVLGTAASQLSVALPDRS